MRKGRRLLTSTYTLPPELQALVNEPDAALVVAMTLARAVGSEIPVDAGEIVIC